MEGDFAHSGSMIDEETLADAVAEGVAMALMSNIDNLKGQHTGISAK